MVRKVYAYPGIASGDILIKVGLKGHIRVPFANGYLDKKMSRPATYATADPVMQQIIERSDLFGHRIFIHSTYGTPDTTPVESAPKSEAVAIAQDPEEVPAEETTTSADPSETSAAEYPEVTTWEDAVKILKAIPGVKVASLRTPASAKKVAALNGVVFPNYNFE